jgi:hypothetical protein
MNTNPHAQLVSDEEIDLSLAEFIGYLWCRFTDHPQHEVVFRFLVSPQDFAAVRRRQANGLATALGDEPIGQRVYGALPRFQEDANAMALVENQLHVQHLHHLYCARLREGACDAPGYGPLSEAELWAMITAPARVRARAAYLTIDSQRPQQLTFGLVSKDF